MQFSSVVLDEYLGEGASTIKAPNAPGLNISPSSSLPLWLGLNQLLTAKVFDQHQKAAVLGFIRHLPRAIEYYAEGRAKLIQFATHLPDHSYLASYSAALSRFEISVTQLHLAATCVNVFARLRGITPLYICGDGSDLDRIRLINNRVKHYDEDIELTAKSTAPGRLPTSPIWLTDSAIECDRAMIEYASLTKVLTDLHEDAVFLATGVFEGIARKRNASQGDTGTP